MPRARAGMPLGSGDGEDIRRDDDRLLPDGLRLRPGTEAASRRAFGCDLCRGAGRQSAPATERRPARGEAPPDDDLCRRRAHRGRGRRRDPGGHRRPVARHLADRDGDSYQGANFKEVLDERQGRELQCYYRLCEEQSARPVPRAQNAKMASRALAGARAKGRRKAEPASSGAWVSAAPAVRLKPAIAAESKK